MLYMDAGKHLEAAARLEVSALRKAIYGPDNDGTLDAMHILRQRISVLELGDADGLIRVLLQRRARETRWARSLALGTRSALLELASAKSTRRGRTGGEALALWEKDLQRMVSIDAHTS